MYGATCSPLPEPLPELVPELPVAAAPLLDDTPMLETMVVGTVDVTRKVELPETEVAVITTLVAKVDTPGSTMPTLPRTAELCEGATENETPMLCPPAVAVAAEGSNEDDLV